MAQGDTDGVNPCVLIERERQGITDEFQRESTRSHFPSKGRRVPVAFEAVGRVKDKLLKHYGFTEEFQLLEKFKVDIIPADPIYIGPPLKSYVDNQGKKGTADILGL